jgi:hypothetical protein
MSLRSQKEIVTRLAARVDADRAAANRHWGSLQREAGQLLGVPAAWLGSLVTRAAGSSILNALMRALARDSPAQSPPPPPGSAGQHDPPAS